MLIISHNVDVSLRIWDPGVILISTIILLPIVSTTVNAQPSLCFGAQIGSRFVLIDTDQIIDDSSGYCFFLGAVAKTAAAARVNAIDLRFLDLYGTGVRPLRWRVRGDFVFAAIVAAEAASAQPKAGGVFRETLNQRTEPRTRRAPDPAEVSVDWDEPADFKADFDPNWFSRRLASSRRRPEMVLDSIDQTPLQICAVPPLEEIEAALNAESMSRHAFYDLWMASDSEILFTVLSRGVLERWILRFSVGPKAPPRGPFKVELRQIEVKWRPVGVSWLGIERPFRLARAEPPLVLVTDEGHVIMHSPEVSDPETSKTNVLDREGVALLETNDSSLIFSKDQYLIVTKTGELNLEWKPLPSPPDTDIREVDIREQVVLLKNLAQQILGE